MVNYNLNTLIFVLKRDSRNDTANGMYMKARKKTEILNLILYYQKDCEAKR